MQVREKILLKLDEEVKSNSTLGKCSEMESVPSYILEFFFLFFILFFIYFPFHLFVFDCYNSRETR